MWWWLPLLALALGVLPATLGFWLAPKTGSNRPYPFFSLLAWLVLVAGAGVALQVPHGLGFAAAALFVLLLAWFWQEAARWAEGPDTAAEERQLGTIVRNRLGRGLAEAVTIFAALVLWVVLDTFAVLFARRGVAGALVAILLALGPLLPLLRWVGMQALQQLSVHEKASARKKKSLSLIRVATLLGIPLAIFLLWILDVLAHALFAAYPAGGFFVILLTGIFSATIGRAFDFLNLSSLSATYAMRLARTFQGASNEERIYSAPNNLSRDVQVAHPKDDLPYDEYHPEQQGGPLHLINVCVNETVDVASDRQVRERKGLPMCVTPHGVSVGSRYFAEWTPPDALPRWQKRRRWREGLDAEDEKAVEKRRRRP